MSHFPFWLILNQIRPAFGWSTEKLQRHFLLVLLLVTLGVTGCASISLPIPATLKSAPASAQSSSEPSVASPETPRSEIDPLRESLASDHWRAGEIWPDPLSGLKPFETLKTNPKPVWQHAGFSPLSLQEKPETSFQLLLLSRENSLAGWNACIILAWQNELLQSQTAADQQRLEQQLKRICLSPPVYEEQTGQEFTPQTKSTMVDSTTNQSFKDKILSRWKTPTAEVLQTENSDADSSTTPPPTKTVSDSLRAAAAEAWCQLLAQKAGDPELHFSPAGVALEQQQIPVAVRDALLRGIARKIPPRNIPGIEACFEIHASGLPGLDSLVGLDACIIHAINNNSSLLSHSNETLATPAVLQQTVDGLDPQQLWPVGLWQLRWQESPEIVNRFGIWLALTKHPLAEGYLKQAMQHQESAAQWQAMRNLGLLGTPETKQALLQQVRQREGTPRAIAILAAGLNDPETVYHFRHDASVTVRCAICRFAGEQQDLQAQQMLKELVADPDPTVQKEAVDALANWDHQPAFPVLATGFLESAIPTRKLIRQKLEQRFGLVMAGPEETLTQRRQILQSIAETCKLDLAISEDKFSDSPAQSSTDQTSSPRSPGPEEQARWNELVTQLSDNTLPPSLKKQAQQELISLNQDQPLLLDAELRQIQSADLKLRIQFYAKQGLETCELFRNLELEDIYLRRQAARKIAESAAKKSLPDWGLQIMSEHMKQEQDLQVCRELIQAVANDSTPAARNVVSAALIHSWPDVRILGCKYVSRHRLPQLAPFLLPLLTERNPSVQLAAIEAAGLCRNPIVIDGFSEKKSAATTGNLAVNHSIGNGQGGLRSLMGTVIPEVEQQVIISLARLGDQQGFSELRKLCHSAQPESRGLAISTLAELGGEETIPLLVRLGWTERHPAVRQTLLKCLKAAVPESDQPEMHGAATYEQKLEVWSTWVEQKQHSESGLQAPNPVRVETL